MIPLWAGLAGLWGWYVLNLPGAPRPIAWVARALRRLPQGRKLMACAWCLGAWLAIAGVILAHIASGDWSLMVTVEAFAAAGITGTIGTMLPDDGTPTDA